MAKQARKHTRRGAELSTAGPGDHFGELALLDGGGKTMLNVVFSVIHDRRGRAILMVRDQNNYDVKLRQKRLMSLAHLFLLYRYKVDTVHYVAPTEDNLKQAERMKARGIYETVNTEISEIIIADVNWARIKELTKPDHAELTELIKG